METELLNQTTGSACEIRAIAGFNACILRTAALELAVVPDLGARIMSIMDLRTGREWMWHPGDTLKLFPNRTGDDFTLSPLAGADECLPTIAPCSWQGRALPDHGEVWSARWALDPEAWERGTLRTAVDLPVSPLRFERVIRARANVVRIDYTLTNLSSGTEKFLWAFHPLLRLQEGDLLEMPASTRALLNGDDWVDAVTSCIPAGGCSKIFAAPVIEGFARIQNPQTGDALAMEWDPTENNTLGLWLTRGGWHGHHHFAMEPTNGAPDPLASAAPQNRCGTLAPDGTTSWTLKLHIGLL